MRKKRLFSLAYFIRLIKAFFKSGAESIYYLPSEMDWPVIGEGETKREILVIVCS